MNHTTSPAAVPPTPTSAPGAPATKKPALPGPCYLKMLVSNLVAGSVIGKNGTVIAQIENETGATMKLSPATSLFPGTADRVVVMGGELEQIDRAMQVILRKINELAVSQYAPDVGEVRVPRPDMTASIVVPKSSVSGIIGKGGAQIKRLQEESKAKIQISNRELGLNERIVSITGAIESVHIAASQISQMIQEDVNLKDNMNVRYPQAASAGSAAMYGAVAPIGFGGYGHCMPPGGSYHYPVPMGSGSPSEADHIMGEQCEIYLEIPDTLIGVVIGKNGVGLSDIMRATNASIKVSQKGDFIPGTENRKVTISGAVAAVHRAHVRLIVRMNERAPGSMPRSAVAGPYGGSSPSASHSPQFPTQMPGAAPHANYGYNQMGFTQPYAQY